MSTRTSQPYGSDSEAKYEPSRKRSRYWEPFKSIEQKSDKNDKFSMTLGVLEPNYWEGTNKIEKILFKTNQIGVGKRVNVFHFNDKIFRDCDIEGGIDIGIPVKFRNCIFDRVDFARDDRLVVLRGLKFTNCEFKFSSFTFCRFVECEFRGCKFEKISLSGNETEFVDCVFDDNDLKGILAAFFIPSKSSIPENKELSEGRHVSHHEKYAYTLFRAHRSKEEISRKLLNCCKSVGYEETFYKSVEIQTRAFNKYRRSRAFFSVKYGIDPHYLGSVGTLGGTCPRVLIRMVGFYKAFDAITNSLLLIIVGFLNGWGRSIGRPATIGLFTVLVFAILYKFIYNEPLDGSFVKAISITLIVGYSFYIEGNISDMLLELCNLAFGLIWYTVFFATLVSRINRIR